MKVFDIIPSDGAVSITAVEPGRVFFPRGYPKDVFMRVAEFGGPRPQFRIWESDASYCIDNMMADLLAGVNVENGRLVMFKDTTKVIPLPAYLTVGRDRP